MRQHSTVVDLDALLAVKTLIGIEPADALDRLAELIDGADDLRREDGLLKGITLAQELLTSGLGADQEALVYYFVGNAWASVRYLRRGADEAARWEWEQPEAREQILAFRRALVNRGYAELPALRRCQVATNLGNLMSSVGRFVDALGYYDMALKIDPEFGMALANQGDCLLHYARALYDDGHQAVFARACEKLIERALKLPLEHGVEPGLEATREYALQRAGTSIADWDRQQGESLGREPEEVAYRGWALEQGLFLNPLNDLGRYPIAANDVLQLPTMRVVAQVGSGFHGFFNQLKQEFIAARCLCFEGLHQSGRSHADERTALLDTWNDTALGLSIEKIKIAFRSAYSLLDKASVLIARYFALNVLLHQVNIRTVWYVGKPSAGTLRGEFAGRENWPLRGLFWLSKDLHEWDAEYQTALEPDAREIAKLRNQLEHQYARVVDAGQVHSAAVPSLVPPDPFGYVVCRPDLEIKTLRMLRTARAALIYLSLALHAEEKRRDDPPSGLVHEGSVSILSG
jgi:tetratricopeptide (TPR) repeat protein